MLQGVVRKDFDLVAAWSVDRLGRSLQHLLAFPSELTAKNVDLYLHQQAVDTSTPAGRALFQMLGVFAEFERAMIVERVKAGLRRATAQGEEARPSACRGEVGEGSSTRTREGPRNPHRGARRWGGDRDCSAHYEASFRRVAEAGDSQHFG